jgi:hypothetical protein
MGADASEHTMPQGMAMTMLMTAVLCPLFYIVAAVFIVDALQNNPRYGVRALLIVTTVVAVMLGAVSYLAK